MGDGDLKGLLLILKLLLLLHCHSLECGILPYFFQCKALHLALKKGELVSVLSYEGTITLFFSFLDYWKCFYLQVSSCSDSTFLTIDLFKSICNLIEELSMHFHRGNVCSLQAVGSIFSLLRLLLEPKDNLVQTILLFLHFPKLI